jgi:hypothetical protein
MDLETLITYRGEEMTLGQLLKNAERWQDWCAVCLGAEVGAVDGLDM